MKSIDELRVLYAAARMIAKSGNNQNRAAVIGNLLAIKDVCKELYEKSTIMQKVKCSNLIKNLETICLIIKDNGLTDPRVQGFFGFAINQSPSFSDILKGEKIEEKPANGDDFISEMYNAPESSSPKAKAKEKEEPKAIPELGIGGGVLNPEAENSSPEIIETPIAPITPIADEIDKNKEPVISFQPESLADFIGQEHVVKRVLAEINAAKKQGLKHIDHILLFGNRGLGKSTLMKLIAKELGVKFAFMDASQFGNDVRSQRNVQKFLTNIAKENAPVVIAFDEIHALPKHIQTGLLTLLNDRVYRYLDQNGEPKEFPIEQFTFIGATTDSQDVLSTLKDRCNNLTFYLKDYTREELAKIFTIKYKAKGIVASNEVLQMCINRCRCSIREVDAFVNGFKTIAINTDNPNISAQQAEKYFKDIDRDPIGLKAKELEILNVLLSEPSGICSEDTLAARVHLDNKVLVKEFEPYLLKIGFISIVARGRSITQKAIKYLKGKEVEIESEDELEEISSEIPSSEEPVEIAEPIKPLPPISEQESEKPNATDDLLEDLPVVEPEKPVDEVVDTPKANNDVEIDLSDIFPEGDD